MTHYKEKEFKEFRSSECFGAQEGKLPGYFWYVFILEPKLRSADYTDYADFSK
jgi:hypothetical protein